MFEHYTKKAIIHVDGDAFFASCEQALNPALKGRPVITGKERGIVSAASYEAKAFGVQRGVPLRDVKKLCPEAVILSSDYESYSLFSKRMFDIIRRYTSEVEEYGIDEAFADITGMRRPLNMSYPKIAHTIKEDIEKNLNITVSVGLAPSKVLAKVASKWNKPSGFTVIAKNNTQHYLQDTPVENIWGIGRQTTKYLHKLGVKTAQQFVDRDEYWVKKHFTKPHIQTWEELRGTSVMPLETEKKRAYKSIQKTKTFTPSSTNKDYVFAQLTKNVENAFIKLRRHQLVGKHISIFLKKQTFQYKGIEAQLSRATAFPNDVMHVIEALFEEIYEPGVEYRATGITLSNLHSRERIQLDLFEPALRIEKMHQLYSAVDVLSQKFGKHTLHLGSSMFAHTKKDYRQSVRDHGRIQNHLVQVGTSRKTIGIPFIGVAS